VSLRAQQSNPLFSRIALLYRNDAGLLCRAYIGFATKNIAIIQL